MRKDDILNDLILGYGPEFPGLRNVMKRQPAEEEIARLYAPSPGLGRYYNSTKFLKYVTSGQAIGVKRFRVIVEYFIALSELMEHYPGPYRKIIGRLTEKEKMLIRTIGITSADIIRAEMIEAFAEHDTAAAVDYVKMRIAILIPRLRPFIEAVHFACTSEDVMGNVFGMVGNELIYFHFLPAVIEYIKNLIRYMEQHDGETFLMLPALTHQQAAEPTTFGKIIVNIVYAILEAMEPLFLPDGNLRAFSGKLGGAIGNLSCHYAAYPDIDWQSFAERFVRAFGLDFQLFTDQCVSYANEAIIFNSVSGILEQIVKFTKDFVRMASCPSQFFIKSKKKGVKGSSIMPGKYNAWASEGGIAMLLKVQNNFNFLASMLQQYPHQGDMMRSFLFRDIGNDMMPFFIAIGRIKKELNNYHPNLPKIGAFFDEYPGMSGSCIQSVLKREGISGDAYRKIQDIAINPDGSYAKGHDFSRNLQKTLKDLNVSAKSKNQLLELSRDMKKIVEPADKLAKKELNNAKESIDLLESALMGFQVKRSRFLLTAV